MANGTVFPVSVGPSHQIVIADGYGRCFGRLLVDSCLQGHVSEGLLKGHGGCGGRNRSISKSKIEPTREGQQNKPKDNTNQETFHLSIDLTLFVSFTELGTAGALPLQCGLHAP